MTGKHTLKSWFDEGERKGAAYMLVFTDTFSYDDYPVYAKDKAEALKKKAEETSGPMTRLAEVYDISMGWAAQSSGRVLNL